MRLSALQSMVDTVRPYSTSAMAAPYSCRLCKATTYRKVRARADDGAQLFRCSGCGVVFSDPEAWREGPPPPPPLDPSAAALLASWSTAPNSYRRHEQSPEELQVIKEAAARANKSKRKR